MFTKLSLFMKKMYIELNTLYTLKIVCLLNIDDI